MHHNHRTVDYEERVEPSLRRRRSNVALAVVAFVGCHFMVSTISRLVGSTFGHSIIAPHGAHDDAAEPPRVTRNTGVIKATSTSRLRSSKPGETPFTELVLNQEKALYSGRDRTTKNKHGHDRSQMDRLDFGECAVAQAVVPNHPIQPTYTTGYPGSGDTPLFRLIEAMTGMVTGDDKRSNGHKNTVTINTHYPCPEGVATRDVNVPRTILLVRNPLDAINSYYNYMYAVNSGKTLGLFDSPTYVPEQAPAEAWIDWRDAYFEGQLQNWVKHIEYWMELYPTNFNRLIVSYERFIDEEFGPTETKRIAEFLSRSDGVANSIRPPEDLPCLWHTIVSPCEHHRKALEGYLGLSSHAQNRRRLEETITSEEEEVGAIDNQNSPIETTDPPAASNQQDNTTLESEPINTSTAAESQEMIETPLWLRYDPPFSGSQFRTVVMVLSQLLEKYRNDKFLAPIIVGYMDDIQLRVQRQMGGADGSNQFLSVGVEETQLVNGKHVSGLVKE